jgi:hypothetical protein
MYDGKTQFLIKNRINRYLINSQMLPDMKTGADGSFTIYIQKDSPGADKESNWLPSPDGPIYLVIRTLLAKDDSALDPASRRRHLETAGCGEGQLKPRRHMHQPTKYFRRLP